MSVGDPSIATISPSTVVIPTGIASGAFEITGQTTIGDTTVTADGTADGYGVETIDITVDRPVDRPLSEGETTVSAHGAGLRSHVCTLVRWT